MDAWREVTQVEGHNISIIAKNNNVETNHQPIQLFFINLGGYKQHEFDEFHYKILVAAIDTANAMAHL